MALTLKPLRSFRQHIHHNISRVREQIVEHGHRLRQRVHKAIASSRLHRTVGILTQWIDEIQVGGVLMMLVLFQSFGSAGSLGTDMLVYPTPRVSTLECRTQLRDEMDESCKIDLPIMRGADYAAYKDQKLYTDIYTTLWGGTYEDGRDVGKGGHPGVDIATAKGTPLVAIADGEVIFAGWQNLYGNVVKVKHTYRGEIIYSVYAHVSEMTVKKGDKVVQGQVIAKVGNTGLVFGQLGGFHVNFEIVRSDKKGNPTRAYSGCPDSRKDRVWLVNEGACRAQMGINSYDPIALIEQKPTTLSSQVLGWTQTKSATGSVVKSVSTGTTKPVIVVSQPEQSVSIKPTVVRSASMSVESDISVVVQAARLPLRIAQGSQVSIQLLFNTSEGRAYAGVLKKSLQLLSSDTGIVTSSLKSIQRVSGGSVSVTITGVKKGVSSVVLMRDGKRLGVIDVVVE